MQPIKDKIIWILLFFPIISYTQALDNITVKLIVHEKVDNKMLPLPNAKLNISDQGEVRTDAQGCYQFVYPVSNYADPQVNVALISDDHKVLKPLDGAIELDVSKQEMVVEFLVVNMTEESPEFKKRIQDLEGRIARLRSKNELSRQQLDALQSKLLDTILYFEANRAELENQIAELSAESETAKRENEELRMKLSDLEMEVNRLTGELQEALEERYLRQNAHFKLISRSLLEFLQRAKDVQDELPFIKEYYNSPGGFEGYGEKLKNYEKVFTQINTEQESYLEGVERYWENHRLSKELEKVLQFLLEGVHLKIIRPTVNDINEQLRKQKPNNAQKIADESFDVLSVNLKVLEKDVNRLLQQLRKNI